MHGAGISEDEHGRPVEVKGWEKAGSSGRVRCNAGESDEACRHGGRGGGSPWVGYEAGASPRTVSLLLGTALGSWQASLHCILPVG